MNFNPIDVILLATLMGLFVLPFDPTSPFHPVNSKAVKEFSISLLHLLFGICTAAIVILPMPEAVTFNIIAAMIGILIDLALAVIYLWLTRKSALSREKLGDDH